MTDERQLQSDLESAMGLLQWYADAANYRKPRGIRKSPVMKDRGSQARHLLAHLKGRHHGRPDQH